MKSNDTTDDYFTGAASVEAAHRDMDPGKHGENNRAWFMAGAEWARERLAEQEVTDAEVIAALGAANRTTLTGSRFDAPLSFYSDATVKAMRAALSAARKA